MIHYHGGPITPETCAYRAWFGRHAFISWTDSRQIEFAASICQSFAVDNGAFSFWKSGIKVDWSQYYEWVRQWLCHPACDWAIIPDVINGSESENDALVAQWPFDKHQGVPVWHLNESLDRLVALSTNWPRIAIGSTDEYDAGKPVLCLRRLAVALPVICNKDGYPRTKLHGLRMLNPTLITKIPLSSADSTNIARSIGIDSRWKGPYRPATKESRAMILVERIENHVVPATIVALRDYQIGATAIQHTLY